MENTIKSQSNLEKFIKAQEKDYQIALNELKNGKKESHWIWYIFPQIQGLGFSSMSKYYSIKNLNEAKEYYNNDILRFRLIELSNILLSLKTNNAKEVFSLDDKKLKSSMTLFFLASNNTIFKSVLDKFFKGELDQKTIEIINRNTASKALSK